MADLHGRGRPRSTGTLLCARCHQLVPKIRVHWPEGAVCGACFAHAANNHGVCAHCNTDRLLPGRSAADEQICKDCAGITTGLACDKCGREGERIRGGLCAACVVTHDLTTILKPGNPPDLRLHRLIKALAAVDRPQSITTWARGQAAADLLRGLGDRTLTLDHAAFDALPPSPAVEHLREMLVSQHTLPDRGDVHLTRFQAWLETRLSTFRERPHIHQPLEQFARWHHLRGLRADPAPADMDYATRHAKQEITEAGKFLVWLDDEHHTHIDDLKQEHIDLYWSEGTSTRKHIRGLLLHRKLIGRKNALTAKARQGVTTPSESTADRLDAIRRVAQADQVASGTRVAALIFLLYGVPIGKIVALQTSSITTTVHGMTINLGPQPAPVPEPLVPMFTDHLTDGIRTGTTNNQSPWLFPSTRAGHHITGNTLWNRLTIFDIHPQATRNTTLFDIAKELDPASMAALLGYTKKAMAGHAARAGTTMGSYPATRPTRR